MQNSSMARLVDVFRILSIAVLTVAVLAYVSYSIHWGWQWDTSIMHYVNLMMDHGKAPYRDIVDMNMPGSYFIEGWAMHLFGAGDLGWRIYEFFLLTVLTVCLIVIARPYDWLAGYFAGVMCILIHGAEGPQNAAQREEVMTIMITAGLACAFTALRRLQPSWMLPFGFLLVLAVSIKPTIAPLGIILLLMALWELHRRGESFKNYAMYALAGFAIASLIILQFLLRYHVIGDFLAIMKRLLPYYASVGNLSIPALIGDLVPRKAMYAILLLALILTIANRNWKNWERLALAVVICFGAFSFVAQRKGFPYHRTPFLVFLMLWIGLEFTRVLKREGWPRYVGLACATGLLFLIPGYLKTIHEAPPRDLLTDSLTQDLNRLGGLKLQNQVQCIDMVAGCLGAMYRVGLVQHMGYMGDYMFFGPPGYIPSTYYRERFMQEAAQDPPRVIVLTTAWFRQPDSFDKIKQWPQFIDLLNSRYTLETTKMCDPANSRGYRIYLLKTSTQL